MRGQILKLVKKNKWLQGIYKSPKSLKLNSFKSSWELGLYQWLDSSPLVKRWESECVKIPYIINGRKKYYLPDVLINNSLLLEIKPKNQIAWKMNQLKFKSAVSFCKLKGWRFQVITKELLNPIFLTEQIKKSKKYH